MDTPAYTPEDAPVPEGEVVIERASLNRCSSKTKPENSRSRQIPNGAGGDGHCNTVTDGRHDRTFRCGDWRRCPTS